MTRTVSRKTVNVHLHLDFPPRVRPWELVIQTVFAVGLIALAAGCWYALWLCCKFLEAIGGP